MKTYALSIFAMLSSFAFADQLPKFFVSTFPAAFVALDCPGAANLQLKEVLEWRQQGINLPNDMSNGSVIELRARANLVSPTAALFAFTDLDGTDKLKNAEFASGGSLLRQSLDLPDHLMGCAVVPLGADVHELRTGPAILVDQGAYDRLGEVDRFVFRNWLRGYSPTALGALLDQRATTGSLLDRFNYNQAHSLPTLFTGQVEISVDGQKAPEQGPLLKGYIQNRGWEAYVTFADDGRLRFVRGGYSSTLFSLALRAPFNTNVILAKNAPNSVQCNQAAFRSDGSIAACDGQFYTSQGAKNGSPIANEDFLTSGSEEYSDTGFPNYAQGPGDARLQQIMIASTSTADSTIKFSDLTHLVTGVTVLMGEPSCSSVKLSSATAVEADLLLPANCVGVIELTVASPPPAPKKAPPKKKH